MVKSLKIILDREFFNPGSFVSGKVVVTVDTTKRYEAIRLELAGRASWTRDDPHDFDDAMNRLADYITRKVFFLRYAILWKREDAPNGELPAGVHIFQFQMELPSDVPSSFEAGGTGSVRYHLSVMIKSGPHCATKHSTTISVPVRQLVSLADGAMLTPMHYDSPEVDVGSSYAACFSPSGPISFSFDLPRRVFCTGERIPLIVNIANHSPRKIRLVATLKWTANFKNRHNTFLSNESKTKVATVSSASIGKSRTVVWDTEMVIPKDIPTSTRSSLGASRQTDLWSRDVSPPVGNSTEVKYFLKVKTKLMKSLRRNCEPELVVPLVIRGGPADEATEQQLLTNFHISPYSLPVGTV